MNSFIEEAHPFSQGLAQVVIDGETGYIDKTGKLVWKTKIPAIPNRF